MTTNVDAVPDVGNTAAAEAVDGPVVDAHCHIYSPVADEIVRAHYPSEVIKRNDAYDFYAGPGTEETNRTLIPGLRPLMTEPSVRTADMDRMGIDVQVLAPFVSQFYYWTDPGLAQEAARAQNEALAAMRSAAPSRFAAIGTVPMQDSRRAVAELEYMVEALGFKGVQISSNVNGTDLDDPRFRPFFRRAQELGVVVLIHPSGFSAGERLQDYFLVNVIGNPMDSTLALTRLIFSGVLEELPALKLCVVHGGGYLPFYSARMDHAWKVRPECANNISRPPSTYLKQVYFDTMVFSPTILATLTEFAGSDHVLLGTDYPFDMGERDPLGLVGSVEGLAAKELSAIRGGNAAHLFDLF